MRRAHLNAKELNGLATVLINDLAERGIRTAADFTGFTVGPAPNGRGGSVYWVLKTGGSKVHVNGIGEHRAKALDQWRQFHLTRATERAPKQLTFADRLQLDERIARLRTDLQAECDTAERTAAATRKDAARILAETLARLDEEDKEADIVAAQRRAEFDAMAEALLALEARLAAFDTEHGRRGPRMRKAKSRSHESPHLQPASPRPHRQATPTPVPDTTRPVPPATQDTAQKPPSLIWLLPIIFYAGSGLTGASVAETAPLWARGCVSAGHLLIATLLLCLWRARRRQWHRTRTTRRMPAGTSLLAWGWLFAVIGIGIHYDEVADASPHSGAQWAAAVIGVVLCGIACMRFVAARR